MNNNVSNFNDELMKMLEESYNESDNNSEKCLISNEPLEDNCIKLECNHKFNYKHIYNEVYKQKKNAWHSEVNKVKNAEIKCPYCRNIQKGLLPHREGYDKVKYVNWPVSLMMLPDNCIYTFASGKRKGEFCGKKCMGKYCSSHGKIILKRKKKEQEKKMKKLEKEKLLKQKLDEEKKKIEKEFNANDPIILPHAENANTLTNLQIEQLIDATSQLSICKVVTCDYIFKKGKNKGQTCPCKKIHQNFLCKFHYKKFKQAMDKNKAPLEKVNQNIKIKTVKYNQNQNIVITI